MTPRRTLVPWILTGALLAASGCGEPESETPMLSRFAQDVDADLPWPEYPRPHMIRGRWLNLNGSWEYALAAKDAPQPAAFSGTILVPFPIESTLSGVRQRPLPEQRLWYRRMFVVLPEWRGERVLLHFGAVDWHAIVSVNGARAGEHKGGYAPFSLDITDLLNDDPEQVLVVSVWDPTDT